MLLHTVPFLESSDLYHVGPFPVRPSTHPTKSQRKEASDAYYLRRAAEKRERKARKKEFNQT